MSQRPVRRIRTDVRRQTTGLAGPPMTAGMSVRDRRRNRRRSPYPTMTLVVTILGIAAIVWMLTWGDPKPAEEASSNSAAIAAPVKAEPHRDPTLLFATEGSTKLHLAVDPGQLTALAFHQASGASALHLTALVPDADMALAAELKAVPPVDAGNNPSDEVWGGVCLRLWRSNRTGQPDTAVDMGANPGTPVWAPVTGTVVQVKPYLLYDKYEDFEIHIKPDGREDIDVVLIHVQDVVVDTGTHIVGGVTRLASVRKMSDKIDIQLGGYTPNGGDHVHMQLNRVAVPGELPQAGGS